jgi:hypothetical protein
VSGIRTSNATCYKLGSFDGEWTEREYVYGDVWIRERTTGPDRLMIAPSRSQIRLMTKMLRTMEPPYWILYVLLVSREDATPGRYQSPYTLESEETEKFLLRFSEFFEKDGRHHLWIGAEDRSSLLVYDNHNIIYAYGELPKFVAVLKSHGMLQSDIVRIPCPHSHNYNSEFDEQQREILKVWDWKYSPLRDGDDPD